MTRNTLLHSIHRNVWKIRTHALGEPDPGPTQDWRTSSEFRGLWTIYIFMSTTASSQLLLPEAHRKNNLSICLPCQNQVNRKMCSQKGLTEKWLLYKRKYWKTAKQKLFLLLHSCYRSLLFRSWEIEKKSISTDIRGVFSWTCSLKHSMHQESLSWNK